MSDGVQVSPKELRNSASLMKANVEEMRIALDRSKKVMDGTVDYFEATSATELRNKYDELSVHFAPFYEKMTEYAIFLEKAAKKYENADTNIAKAADDILQS